MQPNFDKVATEVDFPGLERSILDFWERVQAFELLREKNHGKPKWSFLDGPITANNPMGVHHAWGRTYKDAFQRYFAMTGHELRYQNGFDCFVQRCKARVDKYAKIQTEQSIRLGYWMDWDCGDDWQKPPDQRRSYF